MANALRNPFVPGSSIRYSNRATDSFLMTWVVAANDRARSDWELLFAAWLGERTQLMCPPGMAGFDLLDLPWSVPHINIQQQFFVRSCFALQRLLTEHVGGVLASGFADDGLRSREGRDRRTSLSDVAELQQWLVKDANLLEMWFRRLPLEGLRSLVASQAGEQYFTPWREEPFPTSVAGLHWCTKHSTIYAPTATDAGCCLCRDSVQHTRLMRLSG